MSARVPAPQSLAHNAAGALPEARVNLKELSMISATATSRWLLCRQPRPAARLRLFCFPYAGGGASVFRQWHERLPATVEVCAIQMPGRDARMQEPPCTELAALIEPLARGLAAKLDIPFAFFGHSLGALVGFELARHLRRQRGPQPIHLIVSARRAPQLAPVDPPIYNLPEPAFIDVLVRRYKGIPPAILAEPDLLALFLPILRADLKLTEMYEHVDEPPLDIPITAIGGLDDPIVSRADLAAWKNMTAAPFSMHLMAGDHFFVQNAPPAMLGLIARQLGI